MFEFFSHHFIVIKITRASTFSRTFSAQNSINLFLITDIRMPYLSQYIKCFFPCDFLPLTYNWATNGKMLYKKVFFSKLQRFHFRARYLALVRAQKSLVSIKYKRFLLFLINNSSIGCNYCVNFEEILNKNKHRFIVYLLYVESVVSMREQRWNIESNIELYNFFATII